MALGLRVTARQELLLLQGVSSLPLGKFGMGDDRLEGCQEGVLVLMEKECGSPPTVPFNCRALHFGGGAWWGEGETDRQTQTQTGRGERRGGKRLRPLLVVNVPAEVERDYHRNYCVKPDLISFGFFPSCFSFLFVLFFSHFAAPTVPPFTSHSHFKTNW